MNKLDYYILLWIILVLWIGFIAGSFFSPEEHRLALFGFGAWFIAIFTSFATKRLGLDPEEVSVTKKIVMSDQVDMEEMR